MSEANEMSMKRAAVLPRASESHEKIGFKHPFTIVNGENLTPAHTEAVTAALMGFSLLYYAFQPKENIENQEIKSIRPIAPYPVEENAPLPNDILSLTKLADDIRYVLKVGTNPSQQAGTEETKLNTTAPATGENDTTIVLNENPVTDKVGENEIPTKTAHELAKKRIRMFFESIKEKDEEGILQTPHITANVNHLTYADYQATIRGYQHDLLTPLTIFTGNTELLSAHPGLKDRVGGKINLGYHRVIHELSTASDQLSQVYNKEDWTPEMLDGYISQFPLPEGVKLNPLIISDDVIGKTVVWDKDRITTLLENIMTNAQKAKEDNTLTVSFRMVDNSYQNPFLEIAFADTGPGFPSIILERGFQPDLSIWDKEKNVSGTGVGMDAQNKSLQRGYNGRIIPLKGENGGAVTAVRIPIKK